MPPVIKETAAALSSAPIDDLIAAVNNLVARITALELAVFGANYTPPS